MSGAIKLSAPMSVKQFLAWDAGDATRYELVDGVPRAMAPTRLDHGVLQNELGARLLFHLREHRPGCRVVVNPAVTPGLMRRHNVRIPDIGVTCAAQPPGQVLMEQPLLLAEILSPSNKAKTWSNVWAYTTIASVQTILVLHSTKIAAQVLRRDAFGAWPEEPEPVDDMLDLPVIGFAAPLRDLYRDTGLAR